MKASSSKKLRVLFLDDDQKRHDFIADVYAKYEVKHVYTVTQAVDALKGDRFDVVCLDHDLDLNDMETNYGRDHEETGADVAEYIRLHLPREKYPDLVIVHSWNPSGARTIEALVGAVGIPVSMLEFQTDEKRWRLNDAR